MTNNPFEHHKYLYLVYRSKRSDSEASNQSLDWRTFGNYDSLYIEEKTEFTYKDCFAIRFPPVFKFQQLLGKQVFTLLPFPAQSETEVPRSQLLSREAKIDARPFLGMIMISMNMLQDEYGEEKRANGEPESLAYLQKLIAYQNRLEKLLNHFRWQADKDASEKSSQSDKKAPKKGRLSIKSQLSKSCLHEIMLSTNCSDLCVVMRTNRVKDIYLAAKLIRIHFSLIDSNHWDSPCYNQPKSKILRYMPTITTITAMSNHLDSYTSDINDIRYQNDGMAVDFRVTCNSRGAEKRLQECCDSLAEDLRRESPKTGIYPGERIGGVLGVGHYSVYMPLLSYLDLVFNHPAFLPRTGNGAEPPRSLLARTLSCGTEKTFNNVNYTKSNVRLRFCNNKSLVDFERENDLRSNLPLLPPASNQGWSGFETFLVTLRKKLALFRNQIHFSAYMLKEALSMINDLYYTYNDLLYTENIHSYILATQLIALSGNTLLYLERIEKEISSYQSSLQDHSPIPRRPIIDAIDQLIEMINVIVLSINAYNKNLVAFSQSNLNFPNYEIQSKVNIEKYQVAYTAFVQSLCDAFPKDQEDSGIRILAYVFLNLHEKDTNARQCFWVNPFPDVTTKPVGLVRMLSIASPNYRRFAHMYHLLPQLCHELGHHVRTIDRGERNRIVYFYMLEPTAKLVADRVMAYTSALDADSYSDDLLIMLREIIQMVLLREMETGTSLDNVRFSMLELPVGTYLYEQLNYEQSSFSRFWNCFRDLLLQAGLVSNGKIRIYGAEALEEQDWLNQDNQWLFAVNCCISALNCFLIEKLHFTTGYQEQGQKFRQIWDELVKGWKKPLAGWQKTVLELRNMTEREASQKISAGVLIPVCLALTSGICSAYVDYYDDVMPDVQSIPEDYIKALGVFVRCHKKLLLDFSFFLKKDTSTSSAGPEAMFPSVAYQIDLISKASLICEEMNTAIGNLNKQVRQSDELRRLVLIIRQVYIGMRKAINALQLQFLDRRTELQTEQNNDSISFTADRTAARVNLIVSALQEGMVALQDGLAYRLQNAADLRRWLSAAFRGLDPEKCMRKAKEQFTSYNEVTADLAMCAAMRFTPFGYLAYTARQFVETPEENSDKPFAQRRIRDVVTVLLFTQGQEQCKGPEQDERQEQDKKQEHYHSEWVRLNYHILLYWVKAFGGITDLIEECRNSAVLAGREQIQKVLNDTKAYSITIPDSQRELLNQQDADEISCERQKELMKGVIIPMYSQQADKWIWWLDRLGLEIRTIWEENADTPENQEKRELMHLLEQITDLLGDLRTLQRIFSMLLYIRKNPPKPKRDWHDSLTKLRPLSVLNHYLDLWAALNQSEDNPNRRNEWILLCRKNETLQAISEHYNHYYNRPGSSSHNTESLNQIHFILRYYWEGCLRYRCLRRDKFVWSDDVKDTMAQWFKVWSKNEDSRQNAGGVQG